MGFVVRQDERVVHADVLSPTAAVERLDKLVLQADSRADLASAVELVQTACGTNGKTLVLPKDKRRAKVVCRAVSKLRLDHGLTRVRLAKLIGNDPRTIEAWVRRGEEGP